MTYLTTLRKSNLTDLTKSVSHELVECALAFGRLAMLACSERLRRARDHLARGAQRLYYQGVRI
jgi:hypothetical protein